uniref:Nonstructural protein n=1 Tax=Parvoviridae sp. TaxID=1940570 RepID=A0A7D3UWF3_9VIRU|nr:MAG: nonstructural protein [Parvoviridae sp.]
MQAQVQRSRSCPRRILWRGIPGQSFATSLGEKETTVEREHVLRPMPIVEAECKLLNMKTFIGCVLQIANGYGDILDDIYAYGHLIDSMKANAEWIVIGEVNKDNIFHVHGLMKCNYRTDSWRRSVEGAFKIMATNPVFIERFGTGCTLDCLKCQKAHRTSSLLEYMCKDPKWFLGNSERLLQMAYDMFNWDLGSRFRNLPEPKGPKLDEANPMVQDILAAIMQYNCTTMEELMRADPDMVIKYLHRPGFSSIAQNCLTYAKCTKSAWKLSNYAHKPCDPSAIHQVLLHQGINVDQWDLTFYRWLTKQNGKKNTICIEGPSNTGKTSFWIGFRQNVPSGEVVNGQSFNYEGLVECYVGFWDEPLCADEQAEKFKQIAGGEPCTVPVKHKKPALLKQIPMVITTNRPFWYWCPSQEDMFRNRFNIYQFNWDATSQFFCRTRSECCECKPCLFSRGGEAGASGSTTGRLPRSKQSAQSLVARHSTEERAMGERSMRPGGKRSAKTPGGSRRRERSPSGAAASSSSSTISHGDGSSTKYRSSDTISGMGSGGSGSKEQMGRDSGTGGSDRDDNRGTGGTDRRGDGRTRGDSENDPSVSSMVSMGGTGSSESEMEDEISAKKRKLAREVATMTVPTREQWASYFSYLWAIYERKPIDLTCYESSLSDTEDD